MRLKGALIGGDALGKNLAHYTRIGRHFPGIGQGSWAHDGVAQRRYAVWQMMRYRVRKPEYCCQGQLSDWFETAPGKELLALEVACLVELLPDLFGYYLLQLGWLQAQPEFQAVSRFRTKLVLDWSQGNAGGRALAMRGDPAHLPVATDSIDAILMPHTLDFSADPHQVLREAERVLIPEGRLLIIGFNPWSLWGLWRLPRMRSKRIPWCGHFLSLSRLHDWLSLLGFDVEQTRYLMYRPPLARSGVLARLEFVELLGRRFWLPLSGVYVVQAVKRVSTLTPLTPSWKQRRRVLGGQVVEPSMRKSDG